MCNKDHKRVNRERRKAVEYKELCVFILILLSASTKDSSLYKNRNEIIRSINKKRWNKKNRHSGLEYTALSLVFVSILINNTRDSKLFKRHGLIYRQHDAPARED